MVPSCLSKINDCPDPGKTIANLISFANSFGDGKKI
jgi:hypothetical protein